MCGIAGAVGRVDRDVVRAVERADLSQVHRGPDDHGMWADPEGRVVLAHRRLSIIDLSPDGRQPMVDPGTGCVLVFNGEVYNFRSLRDVLQGQGHRFTSRTDSEVVLKAFVQWGPSCVDRLHGMFAFGVWDPRDRTLTLARDRMGVKPLYTFVGRDGAEPTLWFASELRALLATDRVPRRIDRMGLASYVWNGFVYGPQTLVEGVRLLEAGTVLRHGVEGTEGTQRRRYWTLPDRRTEPATPVSELEATLDQVVRERLVADVPVGVFLSGGIDSSAVSAMAARAAPGAIHTFNVGFEEAEYDESSHARAVADAIGTRHQEIRLTESQFADQLADAFASIDQPTFDALNTYFVSRAVREAGVTVALAGTGGDELFGGYTSFVDLPAARRAARAVRGLPSSWIRAGASAAIRAKMGRFGALPPQTRWGKLGDVLTSGGDLSALYQTSYGLFTQPTLRRLMPGFDDAGCRHGVPEGRWRELRSSVAELDDLDAISALELQSFVTERLLRDTDASSMAVSLEVRVPLLDHRFVSAVMGADPHARFTPLRKKMLLRHLALRHLDPDLFDRPKSGFVMPFEVWCRRSLRGEIEPVVRDAETFRTLGLDPKVVAAVFESVIGGAPGFYWSRLWALYVLARWCQTHLIRR